MFFILIFSSLWFVILAAEFGETYRYILCGATDKRLKKEAELISYSCLLDSTQCLVQGKMRRMPLALVRELIVLCALAEAVFV